jgi:hypothetical protein
MAKRTPGLAGWLVALALLGGCAAGDEDDSASGPKSTSCQAVPCNADCVALGHRGGICEGVTCVCINEDVPPGEPPPEIPEDPPSDDTTPGGEACGNGLDDNGDGLVDCDEPACCNTTACASAAQCRGCVPTVELCTGAVDEDCDGLIDCLDPQCMADPACVPACEEEIQSCSVGGCNGYIGDEIDEWSEVEECMTHNDRGCGEDELYAWCSRYWDTDEGGAWYDFIRDWVASRCPGEVLFDEESGTYYCRDEAACIKFQCTTPIVLVFDPVTPVTYQAYAGCGRFDLSAKTDGSAATTDWPTAATPWLGLDRDGDGAITSGAELFGSATPTVGGTAKNGFAALGELDADGDGAIASDDPAFAQLVLWSDLDGDRVSSPRELRPLSVAGVLSLRLSYTTDARCDVRGNCEVERASFVWRDSDGGLLEGAVVDVHLPVR